MTVPANDITTPQVPARAAPARKSPGVIEANPLGVIAGGIALGVLAGAVLPATAREAKLLGPVGRRITDTASGAIQAARDAGRDELDTLGISRTAARDQATKLVEGVLKTIATAGAAAISGAGKAAPKE